MDSTVQPDKKLMAATVSSSNRSSTGLMTTPPPMPQMAPTTLARKLTKKKIAIVSTLLFPHALTPGTYTDIIIYMGRKFHPFLKKGGRRWRNAV